MSEINRHINLGQGITAEIATGTFIILRGHKDPDVIPGDTVFSFLLHDIGANQVEIKIYNGRAMKPSERARVQQFVEQIEYKIGLIERFKNGRSPRAMKIRAKDGISETDC
ncbi:hypothetical protein [Nitrosospira sp. NpAV]|uniref:hypothetical protein n=1 Tax=Nitrosospira sp. NpAV TaxID=58133 RepID=UPI00059FF4C5|nr:hypothetical protein [Nitrosospira sp. NpAV]KIO49606.1 hypothetical protein SQ11_05650 [Nitrosospira sp. NpAV]